MKKLIATCTLAVGVLAASNSFGQLTIPTTKGPIFNVDLSGTVTYDTTGTASITYKGVTTSASPTLRSAKFAVKDLIKLLNKSYIATNILIDVTGGDYHSFPLDAHLVVTPYADFGSGETFGSLALVNASGFYFPLEGETAFEEYLNYYESSSYYFADLYFSNAAGSSSVDTDTLAGTETDSFAWQFFFDDYNFVNSSLVYIEDKRTSFELNGWASATFVASAFDENNITSVSVSGTGTGNSADSSQSYWIVAPQSYVVQHFGGNAQISAKLTLSGSGTENVIDETEFVSDFFPWNPVWAFINGDLVEPAPESL